MQKEAFDHCSSLVVSKADSQRSGIEDRILKLSGRGSISHSLANERGASVSVYLCLCVSMSLCVYVCLCLCACVRCEGRSLPSISTPPDQVPVLGYVDHRGLYNHSTYAVSLRAIPYRARGFSRITGKLTTLSTQLEFHFLRFQGSGPYSQVGQSERVNYANGEPHRHRRGTRGVAGPAGGFGPGAGGTAAGTAAGGGRARGGACAAAG